MHSIISRVGWEHIPQTLDLRFPGRKTPGVVESRVIVAKECYQIMKLSGLETFP
jgi:hypothetical protein